MISEKHGPQKLFLSRYLDTAGDGSGTKNAVGNYSLTADSFYIQPAAGQVFRIVKLHIYIEDSGAPLAATYGANTALTNGVSILHTTAAGATTRVNLTDALPLKQNADLLRLTDLVTIQTFASGNNIVRATIYLGEFGQEIRLDGDTTDRLEVTVNDDLTGLVGHYFKVEGYIENRPY